MSRDKERRDANPYKVIKLKTKRQNFVYWVFEDPDFQRDVRIIKDWRDNIPKSASRNDVKRRKDATEDLKKRKMKICNGYGISDNEFSTYYYSLQKWHLFNSKLLDIRISEIDDYSVSIRLIPDITYEEYKSLWSEIQEFIKDEYPQKGLTISKTRRKQEVDYQLVYAVDKARRNSIRYSEIYKQYKSGTLSSYNRGKGSRFDTDKELKDYYLLNRTKAPLNT